MNDRALIVIHNISKKNKNIHTTVRITKEPTYLIRVNNKQNSMNDRVPRTIHNISKEQK